MLLYCSVIDREEHKFTRRNMDQIYIGNNDMASYTY